MEEKSDEILHDYEELYLSIKSKIKDVDEELLELVFAKVISKDFEIDAKQIITDTFNEYLHLKY